MKKKKVLITIFCMILVYYLSTFTRIPILSHARILWIETAMTTSNYQWLATRFFPNFVVNDVMSHQTRSSRKISNVDLITIHRPLAFLVENVFEHAYASFETATAEAKSRVGEKDHNGNLIIVDDTEQDVTIIQVEGITYTGRLLFVPDPSRVVVSTTENADGVGQYITELCQNVGGIAAINGNGGSGVAGHLIGWSVSNGVEWGSGSKSFYTSIGFDTSDRLIIGNIEDFSTHNIRDLVQFMPALIVDGEKLVTGHAGWGIHPRTAVGQTADGTVILAVIDGRKIGYSIGITLDELADIFISYGTVNAGMCDGGTSSILCYNDNIIGIPASFWAEDTGKCLPNALVVLKK